ncbi:MAG: IS481 family transposase [Pseudomonadota bacterium]
MSWPFGGGEAKTWVHPIDGTALHVGRSTLERWYYLARHATDPVGALLPKPRSDRGSRKAMTPVLIAALEQQYRRHPGWTMQLHADNVRALVAEDPERYGGTPSYATVRRVMRSQGWRRQRRARTAGQRRALARLEAREVRSYEASHVHGLWHLDFHEGRRRVLDANGAWATPHLLAIHDDRSRLCCHLQWYLAEDVGTLVHGLMQALARRALPRAVMHDNGAAMRAAEFLGGLSDLGIQSEPTLAYSPYQNGKIEAFWDPIEQRLMPMLEDVEGLTLGQLNRFSHAWVEGDYNRVQHDELDTTPLARLLEGPDVGRASPEWDTMRRAFTATATRKQRRSDGTVSIDGVRFELPSRLRTLDRPTVRWARWDRSIAWVVDPRTNDVLAMLRPLDRERNADGLRRTRDPIAAPLAPADEAGGLPPLMRRLLADFAATGRPPPFLPQEPSDG